MITTADEFVKLRESNLKEEQNRATHDTADLSVWLDIINKYPDFQIWVIHNKTVPIEILELLATNKDSKVRGAVARKRKINESIFKLLSVDMDENVRYDLMCNTKLPLDKIKTIKVDDSVWLTKQLEDKLKNTIG